MLTQQQQRMHDMLESIQNNLKNPSSRPAEGETGEPKCLIKTFLQTTIGLSPFLPQMTAILTPYHLTPVTQDATPTKNPTTMVPPLLNNNYTQKHTEPCDIPSNAGLPTINSNHPKLKKWICLSYLPQNSEPRDSCNKLYRLLYTDYLRMITGEIFPRSTQFTFALSPKMLTLYPPQITISNGEALFALCWRWMRTCYASRNPTFTGWTAFEYPSTDYFKRLSCIQKAPHLTVLITLKATTNWAARF